MAEVAKKYQDNLGRIRKNVEKSREYFKDNYNRYHTSRNFVFNTSVSDDELVLLEALGKPQVEFNSLEAFISRLRGEFSKQEPSITVRPAHGMPANMQLIDLVEGHMRAILFEANNNSMEYEVYTDLLSGGFSVMKCWTDYANPMSMDQVIKIGRVYDPTLCGFDPLARYSHKGDGMYCFELYPKSKEEFQQENPNIDVRDINCVRNMEGFNWSYANGKDDILLVCDYYEKKKKKTKIVKDITGKTRTMEDYKQMVEDWQKAGHLQPPPGIVGSPRMTEIEIICRYRLIENQILEYRETNYKYLPLVFVDGNSVVLRQPNNSSAQQMTRPYIYHAIGIQKLKNFAGQTLANELENMVMHKWKVAKESIPPEYLPAYTDNQTPRIVVYNAFYNNDPTKPLPPPMEVARVPAPPEVSNTFATTDQMMQSILGAYDASLGINNNQLSGVAIVEGATQSNSSAMPYVVGFLQGLNQLAQIIIDLLPKYITTPRTIPVVKKNGQRDYMPINQPGTMKMSYPDNALEVRVEAGVNFGIQKTRTLQQITAMMQSSEIFAQFMNEKGLKVLVKNMEGKGMDELEGLADQFMIEMQQQKAKAQNQPNPVMMKMQLEQQKFQATNQQNQIENQLKAADIANDAQSNDIERTRLMLQTHQAGVDDAVQFKKADTERFAKAVDLALATQDQAHRHAKETVEVAHNILTSQQQPAEETTNV